MAESADSQAQRESLERDLQHVRSVIRTLREAAETTQPDQGDDVPVGTSRGVGNPTPGGVR